ncbi:Lysine methyltransferase [Dillenia turbinata]|uniref:Lysine methyltransferase n=1 Tax=Dillenia turbinata TaxID=194707 RepID=A0AAN8Z2Y2_9MAGN
MEIVNEQEQEQEQDQEYGEEEEEEQERNGADNNPIDDSAGKEQMLHHHVRSIDSTIKIRQLRSEGLSFQLWPAATTLVNLIDNHRSDPTKSPLSKILTNSRRLRILELGAGTGFVGIAAGAILSADVTLTDLPHVLENLRFNAALNSDLVEKFGGKVEVAALRWGEVEDMEAIRRRGEYDVIVGSDVVYHKHLYEPLMETLRFLMVGKGTKREESESESVFVMGHLKRWKKEAGFFKRAKKAFEIEVVYQDEARDGGRVGVLVYRFSPKSSKFQPPF